MDWFDETEEDGISFGAIGKGRLGGDERNTSNLDVIMNDYRLNGNLKEVISKKRENKDDFSLFEMVRYLKELINGLKTIHSQNLHHTELKPENILIGENGTLKIDFISDKTFTEVSRVNCESDDIYSVGKIMYEIYTLREKEKSKDELGFNRVNRRRYIEIEDLIREMLKKDINKRIKLEIIEERIEEFEELKEVNNEGKDLKDKKSKSCGVYDEREDCVAPSYYVSETLNFYLRDGRVNKAYIIDFYVMSQKRFNEFWRDEYRKVFFPSTNQKCPRYNEEDRCELKKHKNEFLDYLYKLIGLLANYNEEYIPAIEEFLKSIEEDDCIDKIGKEKKFVVEIEEGKEHARNNYDEAIECFQNALEHCRINHEKCLTYIYLATIYQENEKSIEYFERGLSFATFYRELYDGCMLLGDCYKDFNDMKKSIEYYEYAKDYAFTETEKKECYEKINNAYKELIYFGDDRIKKIN